MPTNIHREPAKIYTFPVQARAKAEPHAVQAGSVISLASKRAPVVSYDAWYHEAAIRDAGGDKAN